MCKCLRDGRLRVCSRDSRTVERQLEFSNSTAGSRLAVLLCGRLTQALNPEPLPQTVNLYPTPRTVAIRAASLASLRLRARM